MPVPRESRGEPSYLDPSEKAALHLSALLNDVSETPDIVVLNKNIITPKAPASSPNEGAVSEAGLPSAQPTVSADAGKSGAPILSPQGDRDTTRLLLITRNVTMRQLGSQSQKWLTEIGKVFAEIHVIILNEFTEQTVSTVRLADNVWLYSTDSHSWWKMGFDAYRIANEQLIFAGVFRADVIVAEDPFEAGAVAYMLSQKYKRPVQVHILEDMYRLEFREQDQYNGWRLILASFILKRVDSVRTLTEPILEGVVGAFPDLSAYIDMLPAYHNLKRIRETVPRFTLQDRYPQFNFFILHISHMETKSHTKEVLSGVAPILRTYPTVGLIIVGNGPHRPALEKQTIALRIQGQVEFEPMPDELISHMKSAQVLIHMSEDPSEDILILHAAAVKLPIIASAQNLAGTLLEDDVSAFVCETADPSCVSTKLKTFLGDNQIRARFMLRAEETVFSRIEQDYGEFLLAYRRSIERCMTEQR